MSAIIECDMLLTLALDLFLEVPPCHYVRLLDEIANAHVVEVLPGFHDVAGTEGTGDPAG